MIYDPAGWLLFSWFMAAAADTPEQPVHEVALTIAEGGAFTDADAVRVARAYVALTGVRRPA